MKIAYIFIQGRTHLIGTYEYLNSRAESAAKLGLDLHFIVLNDDFDKKMGKLLFVKFKLRNPVILFWARNFRKYGLIEKSVDLTPYDYLIVRYSLADKSGISFAKKYKVLTEHHTDTLSEMKEYVAEKTSFLRKIFRLMKLHAERKYAGEMLSNCRGLIAVTDEIRCKGISRIPKEIPSITISNGVELAKIAMTGFVPFDGRTLNIACVTSILFPWGGLDRLLKSLAKYNGSVKINLHVIGPIDEKLFNQYGYEHVRFYGAQKGNLLDEIMKKMNIAVSVLALFRKNMAEASALRTRGYLARGLPFFLAYEDADLAQVPHDRRFYLSFPNDESLLDIDKIISFAEDMTKRGSEISIYMREYARKYVDISAKTRQLWDFVESIENNRADGR